MAGKGEHDRKDEVSRGPSSPCVSWTDRQGGAAPAGKPPKAKTDPASPPSTSPLSAAAAGGGGSSSNEKALMKRTLVAQSKKIQQLTAKIDRMEAERGAMAQQVDALRMAVFEASTRAEQTAEQYKRDAVEAAMREIAEDREAFAAGRQEALKRIGDLEDALEIALKAAGGVHRQLLELGLSCEDLGKTSVHLSVQAQEAPAEDKPALAVAGETIEAVVGVMRAMERSGVFDILDPVGADNDDDDRNKDGDEGGGGAGEPAEETQEVETGGKGEGRAEADGPVAGGGGGAVKTIPVPGSGAAARSSRPGPLGAQPSPPPESAPAATLRRVGGEGGKEDGVGAEVSGDSGARRAAAGIGQGAEVPTAATAATAAEVGVPKGAGEQQQQQQHQQQQQQQQQSGRPSAHGERRGEAVAAKPTEDGERTAARREPPPARPPPPAPVYGTAAAVGAALSGETGSPSAPQERQSDEDHKRHGTGDDEGRGDDDGDDGGGGLGEFISEAVTPGQQEEELRELAPDAPEPADARGGETTGAGGDGGEGVRMEGARGVDGPGAGGRMRDSRVARGLDQGRVSSPQHPPPYV